MRIVFAALAAILLAGPAFAEDIEKATLDAIVKAASAGYDNPAAPQIRNVHKSKEPGGRGYCGQVSIEEMEGNFTTFHVTLAADGGSASLIRPYDLGSPNFSDEAAKAHETMRTYGCIE